MQQYFFETIQYDKHIPARIVVGYETLSDSFARMHWHREIELFYMINGHASFEGMGLTTTLESDGLILFNSEEPHRMFQNESNRLTQYLVLHLPELFMHILNCICKWLCMIRQLQSCQPV